VVANPHCSVQHVYAHTSSTAPASLTNKLVDLYATSAQRQCKVPSFTMDRFTPFHPSFGYIETNLSSFVPHLLAFVLSQDSSFRPLRCLPYFLYDSHPPPTHPYLHATSAFAAALQLYLRSAQLNTADIRYRRLGDTALCCRMGCAAIETIHHVFVQCSAFNEIRGSHMQALVQATGDLLSAELPYVGEALCAVARHLFCDDADVWPQVHSMYYLGVLPSLTVVRILHRLTHAGATVSAKKLFLCHSEVIVVGQMCNYDGRIPDNSKVSKIHNWPSCETKTEVRGFLGIAGTVRIWIKDFATLARPLVHLTRVNVPFSWGPDEQSAMDQLKLTIINSPAIRPIDYQSNNEVILAVDSSQIAVGYILSQIDDDRRCRPSRFGSITWNECESRYSQAKIELYGLFRALRAVKVWIIGVKNFTVEVDTQYIKGMLNNPDIQPNASMN